MRTILLAPLLFVALMVGVVSISKNRIDGPWFTEPTILFTASADGEHWSQRQIRVGELSGNMRAVLCFRFSDARAIHCFYADKDTHAGAMTDDTLIENEEST